MYKAVKIGTQIGRITNDRYRYFPGQTIDAPNGDLYGLPGVKWIGKGKEKKPRTKVQKETIIPDKAVDSL